MTKQSMDSLSKFGVWVSCGAFLLSVLLFWLGLSFIRAELFTHYFNPQKHVIVKQNPDTKEIYAWKDSSGNVYTPEDSQVKNFTWGTTALLLLVMIAGAAAHNLALKFYARMLREKEAAQHAYLPGLQ